MNASAQVNTLYKKPSVEQALWEQLTPEEKRTQLYRRQKQLLEMFLERHAISQAQFEKSLGDLTAGMGIHPDAAD